jgi:hypothetical protein
MQLSGPLRRWSLASLEALLARYVSVHHTTGLVVLNAYFKCALKATVIHRRHRLPHPITNNLHDRLHNRHHPAHHRRAGPAHSSPHRLVSLRLCPPSLLNDSLVVHHDAQYFHLSAVPGPRPTHSGRPRGGVCLCLSYLFACIEEGVESAFCTSPSPFTTCTYSVKNVN